MLNKLAKKIIYTLLLILNNHIPNAKAQLNKTAPSIGNWTMFFGQVRFNDKLGIFEHSLIKQ